VPLGKAAACAGKYAVGSLMQTGDPAPRHLPTVVALSRDDNTRHFAVRLTRLPLTPFDGCLQLRTPIPSVCKITCHVTMKIYCLFLSKPDKPLKRDKSNQLIQRATISIIRVFSTLLILLAERLVGVGKVLGPSTAMREAPITVGISNIPHRACTLTRILLYTYDVSEMPQL